MDPRYMGLCGMDHIELAQVRDHWSTLVNRWWTFRLHKMLWSFLADRRLAGWLAGWLTDWLASQQVAGRSGWQGAIYAIDVCVCLYACACMSHNSNWLLYCRSAVYAGWLAFHRLMNCSEPVHLFCEKGPEASAQVNYVECVHSK
jgi:hypothetical protein